MKDGGRALWFDRTMGEAFGSGCLRSSFYADFSVHLIQAGAKAKEIIRPLFQDYWHSHRRLLTIGNNIIDSREALLTFKFFFFFYKKRHKTFSNISWKASLLPGWLRFSDLDDFFKSSNFSSKIQSLAGDLINQYCDKKKHFNCSLITVGSSRYSPLTLDCEFLHYTQPQNAFCRWNAKKLLLLRRHVHVRGVI